MRINDKSVSLVIIISKLSLLILVQLSYRDLHKSFLCTLDYKYLGTSYLFTKYFKIAGNILEHRIFQFSGK